MSEDSFRFWPLPSGPVFPIFPRADPGRLLGPGVEAVPRDTEPGLFTQGSSKAQDGPTAGRDAGDQLP